MSFCVYWNFLLVDLFILSLFLNYFWLLLLFFSWLLFRLFLLLLNGSFCSLVGLIVDTWTYVVIWTIIVIVISTTTSTTWFILLLLLDILFARLSKPEFLLLDQKIPTNSTSNQNHSNRYNNCSSYLPSFIPTSTFHNLYCIVNFATIRCLIILCRICSGCVDC